MNKLIYNLMIEAGYACPEIATRARKLVDLVVRECCLTVQDEVDMRQPASTYVDTIQLRFRVNDDASD